MSRPPLPLRAIAVFEAASRLGSFQLAASELNLTPSAVSHQIRLLEQLLGVQLFERVGRGVLVSPEAADYARVVRQMLRRLREATDDMAGKSLTKGSVEVVNIQTPPSFASCWLLPRLSGFMTDYPGIEISVNAEKDENSNRSLDLMIVYGEPSRWQDRATCLLEETIQPLCAPSYLRRRPISTPEDLLQNTLIKTRINAISWEDWFQSFGFDCGDLPVQSICLDPSHVAIAAAVKGMGAILESSVLTQQNLIAGELVSPLQKYAISGQTYWIMSAHRFGGRRAVDTVFEWLRAEAAETVGN
jgi:LysR family transcriptional regulator, glycine cleavage system transcriptional activator